VRHPSEALLQEARAQQRLWRREVYPEVPDHREVENLQVLRAAGPAYVVPRPVEREVPVVPAF